MARFRYVALDASGVETTGESDAGDFAPLAENLAARGMTLLRLEPLAGQGVGTLDELESYTLAQHVAGLTGGGLPLASGLRALEGELPAGNLRGVIRDLSDRLDRGETLDVAFDAMGRRLPPYLRGLILAGSSSGRIGTVLGEFVSHAQLRSSLRRGLWMSTLYPIMLLVIFLWVMVYLSYMVIHEFKMIFMDFGVDIPWATRYLFTISEGIRASGWWPAWGPIAIAAGGYLAARFLIDAPTRRELLGYVPLIGPIARWASLAEFTRYFSILLDSHLPSQTALPLAAEATSDQNLLRAANRGAEELRRGAAISDVLATGRVFPEGLVKLVRWGEENGSVAPTLLLAAEMFETRARAQASFASSIFGIITVLVIIWGCMFVVLALFWPLLSLLSKLSG